MNRAAALLFLVVAAFLAVPGAAAAHPLGNFTVNHHNAITLRPDAVLLRAVVDLAEIPTVQEQAAVRAPGYAEAECAALGRAATATVDGVPLTWTAHSAAVEFPPGEAGLATTRLTCEYSAGTDLTAETWFAFNDTYRSDRIGWHELVLRGDGVAVVDPPVPATSISDELRAYPENLLADPLDVREATARVRPGISADTAAAGEPAVGGLDSWIAKATNAFTDLAGSRDLTPVVGALAILLSLLLGASHAALPGHGKTIIAAYLAGKQGSTKDALVVGATVTLTHTAGVLVLGLLISVSSAIAGEGVLRWLGVASGVLVAAIGVGLLRSAVRRRATTSDRDLVLTGHGHGHGHGHGPGRAGLIGMGIAGGLVPSPSALVVLLGAIGLGRTWFGVVLVLGYGLGMAATLTAVGLVLVRLRDKLHHLERFGRLRDRTARLAGLLPVLTATLVLFVGIGLALRAATGIG